MSHWGRSLLLFTLTLALVDDIITAYINPLCNPTVLVGYKHVLVEVCDVLALLGELVLDR